MVQARTSFWIPQNWLFQLVLTLAFSKSTILSMTTHRWKLPQRNKNKLQKLSYSAIQPNHIISTFVSTSVKAQLVLAKALTMLQAKRSMRKVVLHIPALILVMISKWELLMQRVCFSLMEQCRKIWLEFDCRIRMELHALAHKQMKIIPLPSMFIATQTPNSITFPLLKEMHVHHMLI